MEIASAIVHLFSKARHENSVVKMANSELPLNDFLIQLAQDVRKIFGNAVNKGYGAFQGDSIAYPFSVSLQRHASGELDIVDFTVGLQQLYQRAIDGAPLSTGGYLLFIKYSEADSEFLFVVSLKKRAGTGVDDETLTLQSSFHLDMQHIHEAARINITSWLGGHDRYITFIKTRSGKTDRSATDYFREFIGVTEVSESSQQTKALIQALGEYCTESALSADHARSLREKLFDYFKECTSERKGVDLEALSMYFNDQEPRKFAEFLEEKGVQISNEFEPNPTIYRSLKRFRIKDSKLTLDFEESILGSRILFNQERQSLEIKNLPKEILDRLNGNALKDD